MNTEVHRIVRLALLPRHLFNHSRQTTDIFDIETIKKHIGRVRALPVKPTLSSEPDFLSGSNVHWKLTENFTLSGSNKCTSCCDHGIYASSKCCSNDSKYKIVNDIDVSDWGKVISFFASSNIKNFSQIIKEESQMKNFIEEELCLCLKMNTIDCDEDYQLKKVDQNNYIFENLNTECDLEPISDIAGKFDCFMLPNIGLKYEWKPCCLKWRRADYSKRTQIPFPNDEKLIFVNKALLFLQNSGEECATKVMKDIFNFEKFEEIFALERNVQDFIKSAVEYYDKENDLDNNFCDQICLDFFNRNIE